MKILRVTHCGYETGGVESGIVLMQPLLEARGHVVKTLASTENPHLPHFNEFSYKKFSPMDKVFYSFNPYAYAALKKTLKEFQPDVVNIHTIGEASPSIFFALKNYPTVLTIHGPEVYSKNLLLWCFPESNFKLGKRELKYLTATGWGRYLYHRSIHDFFYTLGLRNVQKLITLSHYMHALMEEEQLHNEYIPNGTILFGHDPLQKSTITHTLAYVGRLERYKGVEYLLRALPGIVEKFPDTHLYIAGDGSQKAELQRHAVQLGLDGTVTFLGHINRAALEILYRRASVVVMPSIYPEAFGKVGIEAMGVGRPVVASDVGGISDWLTHNETGLLVSERDPKALSEAILLLFSDEDMLIRLGKHARVKAEEFDLREHVKTMEKIYLEAIALHKEHSCARFSKIVSGFVRAGK